MLVVVTFVQQGYYLLKLLQSPEVDLYFFRFDIDFETGMLIISKTLYYKTMNDYKFVEPKTQASNRTIYIDADTIKELQEWKAVQAKVLPNCGHQLNLPISLMLLEALFCWWVYCYNSVRIHNLVKPLPGQPSILVIP